MDWDNTRIFLAIYRCGTLRGAAAQLLIDQATVGRRLASLEQSLRARLFLRTPAGYVPTPAGELAFQAAERMEAAALQLQRQTQGIDEQLSGTVRVACTDTTVKYALMQAVKSVHAEHPDIRIVLTASTQLSNLTRRDADLAVRPIRPDNPDLITRHIGRRKVGIYASRDYLAARGEPVRGTALAGHDAVIYQRGVLRRPQTTLCGEPLSNARIVLEANTGLVLLEALQAGLGLGEAVTVLADADPLLVRLWPERSEFYDMWLVMHGDLNRTARVRAVADAIVAVFGELLD
ncbi:LysR family transcriptional regulator [Allopusillimonas soli]|uniref:LysR family transcriptional regulator n=1 Tax=Allopusillimonas soli TaxID=659016 RepID=A0A853F826_9BURK|nr:LysR family transcriptional regulator [Allopusillimonas soli]NYT36774.1 LysR family transcriptional regulator [Allopusillimonas soli]TEA75245.1 LysR family transcriptional regulator [Allopusillimonas soli]